MKTLILQVCIGTGNLDWKNSGQNEADFLNNVTMQSVIDYANKFGYSYKRITTLSPDLAVLPENCMSKNMHITFEKYMHLNLEPTDYDRIVVIDADMFVSPDCPALPPINSGFSGAPVFQWRVEKYHPGWVGRCILVNAGFQMFARRTAIAFFNFFQRQLKNKNSIMYTPYYHDEVLLANFMRNYNNIIYHNLGAEWNDTEISVDESTLFKRANMYHLAGPLKEAKFNRIIKKLKTPLVEPMPIAPNRFTRTRHKPKIPNLGHRMIIFNRCYSDESLVDLDEDIRWALEKDFAEIPKDEHGFRQGEFRVTITWSNEDV